MESRKQSTDDDDTTPEGTPNDKTPTDDDIELEEADDSCSAETDNECKSRSPPCQFCSTAGLVLPAEVLCENCGYQYCYECLNILHPRRGPFTTHRLQSVNRKCEVPVKVFLCPHHEEANPKQVQVYCVSCSSAVCFECTTIKGRHQNHFLRLFKEQAAVGMATVGKLVKELQELEIEAKTDVTDSEKSLEQLQFQFQQEVLKAQQMCASLHLKILSAETQALKTLKKGFMQGKEELKGSKMTRQQWLLNVQQEIRKFDKVMQLSQRDTSPIILLHEAKTAIDARSKSLIIRKPAQTGEFFNTASWVNLARAKLCILVKDATNSIFNPEQLKQEDSNEK